MQFWVDVLNLGLLAGILAVALNVIMGTAGILSFASAGLAGCGAVGAGWFVFHHGFAFIPALLAAAVCAGVIGGALALPTLRLSNEYVIWLTLIFGTVIVSLYGLVPGFLKPIQLGGTVLLSPTQFLPVVPTVTAICCAFCWRISSSPYGRVLRGIREDDDATRAVGKNVTAYRIWTFVLTSAVLGVGGCMLSYYELVTSSDNFNFDATTTIVATVVVGGLGNLFGSFVGAILLTSLGPILEKTLTLNPDRASLWQLVIYGVLLIAMIRLRPQGLIPEGVQLRRLVGIDRASTPPPAPMPEITTSADTAAAVATDSTAPALATTGLSKSFGGIRAVQNLDLVLPEGKITALVGPNGAGKTTVFNLITGRIRPDHGTVALRGRDITGKPPHRVAKLGMVRSFQDVRTYRRLSLLDNVRLSVPGQAGEHLPALFFRPWATRRDERATTERALECLEFVGLEQRAYQLAGSLAFGDQKLLAIARLLATGADILLLDEPASGVDRSNLGPVLVAVERLRDGGKTICLVEHNLDVVERLADHVLFMEQGTVVAEGTMGEITQQPRLADVYFGHVETSVT
jgi:branched-chain amino acid transport system permease protein